MNKKERRQDVKDHIHKLKPSIIGLVETKVKPHKAKRILNCIPPGWGYTNNYAFSNEGRIWVLRYMHIWKCSIINLSSQQITIEAKNNGGLEIVLSFIFRENWRSQRYVLLSELQQIH